LPSLQEIKNVVFALGPDRASGPDGINARAIQSLRPHWEQSIVNEVFRFFHTAQMNSSIAKSNMILVPKGSDPKLASDFIPISVCNVMYKVISKILAQRLKPFIAQLISPEQSAFTPGRDIADNVILVREVLHSFNSSRFRIPAFLLKCDLSKAFDQLRWDYISCVLRSYGFLKVYVNWVMACVTSVNFTILFWGERRRLYKTLERAETRLCNFRSEIDS
jgi:Reverse transcriptase (RNA-dependent DNA polymerase)